MRLRPITALAGLLATIPGLALAHEGHDAAGGFLSGLAHPFTGADHLLAMVAVGLLAAQLGGRALWTLPAAFLSVMAAGFALARMGVTLPLTEVAIALSVLILGATLALRLPLPTTAATVITGAFALFHGLAHGAELPATASALPYAAAFLTATATLHALGLAAGLTLKAPLAQRLAGVAIAVTGTALVGALALA